MSLLGQRPRPAPQGAGDGPSAAPVTFVDELTGWTPSDTVPRVVALVAWLLGVAIRKVWLYVCAPAGALTLLIAFLAS